jgi:hypothetical protein
VNSSIPSSIGDNLSGSSFSLTGYWVYGNTMLTGFSSIPGISDQYEYYMYRDGSQLNVYYGTGTDWTWAVYNPDAGDVDTSVDALSLLVSSLSSSSVTGAVYM